MFGPYRTSELPNWKLPCSRSFRCVVATSHLLGTHGLGAHRSRDVGRARWVDHVGIGRVKKGLSSGARWVAEVLPVFYSYCVSYILYKSGWTPDSRAFLLCLCALFDEQLHVGVPVQCYYICFLFDSFPYLSMFNPTKVQRKAAPHPGTPPVLLLRTRGLQVPPKQALKPW